MSLAVFPTLPGLTYTVVKSANFDTLVMRAPNAYEVRIQQTINPTWDFTLIYDFLHDFFWGSYTTVSELRTMMGFFSQMGGQAQSFLFTDPDDYNVGPALVGGSPNTPLAQLSLVTDGAGNWYSPVQRTLNGVFYEDVTDLNGGITVYANGVLQTGFNYTLMGPGLALPSASYMGLYLKWLVIPTGPITAQFNFYYRVRFASDQQDFEKWAGTGSAAAATIAGQGGGLWTIGGSEAQNGSGTLKLTTARPVPL
jgi:hypothetical protein